MKSCSIRLSSVVALAIVYVLGTGVFWLSSDAIGAWAQQSDHDVHDHDHSHGDDHDHSHGDGDNHSHGDGDHEHPHGDGDHEHPHSEDEQVHSNDDAHAGSNGHGGHGPFVPASTLWAIGTFLVVLWILSKKLIPPILIAMDKRAEEIRNSLDAAEKAKADAEAMMAQHQSDIEKARSEAAAIIEEGRSDAQKLKNSIVEGARRDAEEITARSRREIEHTKNQAVAELKDLSSQLAVDIANELIRKNLTVEDQKQLIEDRIKSFPVG